MVFLLLAIAAGCATTHPPYDYASEPDPRKGEFVLGPSDTLRVTVWRNPELSTDATVRPDGTISLPLVGDLKASGRTSAQIRTEIATRLVKFIKEESAETVTVAVTAINSYRFVVTGNVEHAGAFSANHYVTVAEAMALAGGPNRFAEAEKMVIIREDGAGGVRRIPVDYPAVISGTRPVENLVVVSGDNIYVP